jgi:hypothetical protein
MTLKSPLYSYLPRFLQRLFWDEEVRTQFFQHPDYQFLLAQEAAFLESEIDMSDITISTLLSHPTWQQSQLCLQLINREMDRIKQWLQYPLAFFFPEIVDQLQTYQQSLKRSSDSWINKQLKLIQLAMADKTISDLSTEDQSTLQSAFANLRNLQAQGLCSETIKHQLTDLEQRYRVLCQDELPPAQPVISLQQTFILNTKPLHEVFRETLLDAISSFESKQTQPDIAIEALKSQIEAACSYDKTLLRICVQDYLNRAKKESDFPPQLKHTLQEILDRPQFKPTALNQSVSEERLALNKKALLESIVRPNPHTVTSDPDSMYAGLAQDPWNYLLDELEKHCDTIKNYTMPSTLTISGWNQKLCQYALNFLKHIHALESWDAFVLNQQKIVLLLNTLAQLTQKTLPALHEEINHMVMLIPTLTLENWDLFKRINIEIQIGALEAFVKKDTTVSPEAASYRSQQELAFLKPLPPRAEQKTDRIDVPPPIPLPTNAL